tara:strand:- start:2393 stop:2953 length:561 start_codon:yes stop_codon:yes gene_type:complete
MGTLKKDFKFKLIKNFLTEGERILLKNYTNMFHLHNIVDFDFVSGVYGNINSDTAKYSDYVMESLMLSKTGRVEKESNLKLIPTYSYWRAYTHNAELKKHKDRPSCEVSISCQIDCDGTKWPIKVDGTDVHMENGDAILYLGIELEHSRAPFTGDYHIQTFLHYVDKEGPHTEHAIDKRPIYGVKK